MTLPSLPTERFSARPALDENRDSRSDVPPLGWSRPTRIALVAIVLALFAANIVWIAHDHEAPPWDQAHYLHISWTWRHALTDGGWGHFLSAFYNTDPAYAPLYMLVISPFEALRQGVDATLVANTLMMGVAIVAAAVVASRLFGRRAALLAAVFTATCPLLYGLSRTTLVDVLLVMLVTLAVMAAVESSGFRHRPWAIAFGVLTGLATLTKITAPGILVAPALCCLALPERLEVRRQLTNAALAVGVAVAVALPWFVVNLGPTVDYLRSTTGGNLAIGTTGNPVTLNAFLNLTATTINSIGVVLVLTLAVTGTVVARQVLGRRLNRPQLARIALPVSWFAVGFVVLAVSNNQDVRYLAPGVVGLAVLAAGALGALRPARFRLVVASVAIAVLGWQLLTYVVTVPSQGTARLVLGSGSTTLVVPFDGTPLSYARRPGVPDYATPVLRALTATSHRLAPNGGLTVCLLETNRVINGNTLGFVAETRSLPVAFTDLSYVPTMSQGALAVALNACPSALYIRDQFDSGRVAVLNRSSAAARITDAELASFDGVRTSLPVGEGLVVQVLERASAAHPR